MTLIAITEIDADGRVAKYIEFNRPEIEVIERAARLRMTDPAEHAEREAKAAHDADPDNEKLALQWLAAREALNEARAEASTIHMDATEAAAQFPDAEIVQDGPGGDPAHWRKVDGDWVIDPRPAPRQTVLAYNEFEARFTAAEQDAMATFIYDPPVKPALLKAYNRAVASNRVDLDAPETAAFMDALVAGGVLTADRVVEVLA